MSGLLRLMDLPPVWLVGLMVVSWFSPRIALPSWVEALGLLFIVLGVALAVWAAAAFRKARTTIVPREEPSALVEGGPFRFSRNPIYLADLMILAGWGLVMGSPLGVMLVAVFQQILLRRFILGEEETLREHLGAPYDDYCRRVRRWL